MKHWPERQLEKGGQTPASAPLLTKLRASVYTALVKTPILVLLLTQHVGDRPA